MLAEARNCNSFFFEKPEYSARVSGRVSESVRMQGKRRCFCL